MKAIIDGDMIVYRAAFGSEKEIKWCDDVYTLHMDMNEALDKVATIIDSILAKLHTSQFSLAFSPKKTFRHELFDGYKANRADKRKPLGLGDLISRVKSQYDGLLYANIEADDVIGLICTKDRNCVAVSGDKDFLTLPCKFYNFLKDELIETSEEEANYNHLIQTLTGDVVDGYSGIKGVGIKTAEKLLAKTGATWEGVVEIYTSKGYTEDIALLNAQLAYILRDGDYDFDKQELIKLWGNKL